MTTSRPAGAPLLSARDLHQHYSVTGSAAAPNRVVHAVRGVSLDIAPGEILGLLGETGSGKSTLARALMQLPPPSSGSVHFGGVELARLRHQELVRARSGMQLIFQDPYGSLNPRWTVRAIVGEALQADRTLSKSARGRRAAECLERVGLDPALYADRRPQQLSGGQCQRVAIARALAAAPRLLICDEPTSSLDVLVQKQILALFHALHAELNLAYLFISHDLSLVAALSQRVAVMHAGQMCEIGPRAQVFEAPAHPYTAALIECGRQPIVPTERASRIFAEPSPAHVRDTLRVGCSFRAQCAFATDRCSREAPPLQPLTDTRSVACHNPLMRAAEPVARAQETA